MQRHENRCIITGVYDWCRARRHQVPKASLDYACILPRTARFEGRREELKRIVSFFSSFTDAGLTPFGWQHEYFSVTSWDILQNYVPVTFKTEEQLLADLESSTNAMAMEVDAGYSFQQFLFALEPTQVNFSVIILTFHCLTPDRPLTDILLWRTSTRSMNCALSHPCKVKFLCIRILPHLESPLHHRCSSVFTR